MGGERDMAGRKFSLRRTSLSITLRMASLTALPGWAAVEGALVYSAYPTSRQLVTFVEYGAAVAAWGPTAATDKWFVGKPVSADRG
jgi:hypothetical protein